MDTRGKLIQDLSSLPTVPPFGWRIGDVDYRREVTSAVEGVWMIDNEGRTIFVNHCMAAFLGYTRAEIMGRLHTDFMWEEDRPKGDEQLELRRRGKAAVWDQRYRRKDGTALWTVASCRTLFDDAGNAVGALGRFTDMTAREQAEEHVHRLNAELEVRVLERTAALASANDKLQAYATTVTNALRLAESADRTKSAFLATVSHELRTPLNSILGFTGTVLGGLAGPLNTEQARQLGIVQGSAKDLLHLINQVLDISKIEAGKIETYAERFDMHAVIERVIASIKPMTDANGLALTAVVSQELGEITSDRRRLEQILLNLLSNAVKFTERGSITLTVDKVIGLQTTPGVARQPAVRFRVADTGIGVRPEELATLFEAFRQAGSGRARSGEGTGLGLAISHRLAVLLGGEISAASEWGTGSTFTLVLPLDEPAESAA